MINFRIEEVDDTDTCLEVTLYSNNWELDLSVGGDWPETIRLTKSQLSELIVGLVEIHKEMED